MDSDEKTLHSSQCYGSYCSAIKFVTQSFCEFVTEACTWPSTSYMSVYKRIWISRDVYVLDITVNFMLNKRQSKTVAWASPQTPLGELSALPQNPLAVTGRGHAPSRTLLPVVNIYIRLPLSQNPGSAPEFNNTTSRW